MLSLLTFMKAQGNCNHGKTILAFDPGETIGWCVMQNGELLRQGEIKTKQFTLEQIQEIANLIEATSPDIVVFESYAVYEWKTDTHAWDEVHTAQIIGIIKWEAIRRNISWVKQTAQIAKGFCDDNKLKGWGMYIKGRRHARDAIRHATYYSIFGKSET